MFWCQLTFLHSYHIFWCEWTSFSSGFLSPKNVKKSYSIEVKRKALLVCWCEYFCQRISRQHSSITTQLEPLGVFRVSDPTCTGYQHASTCPCHYLHRVIRHITRSCCSSILQFSLASQSGLRHRRRQS